MSQRERNGKKTENRKRPKEKVGEEKEEENDRE